MSIELDPILPQTEVTTPNPLVEADTTTYVNSFKGRVGAVIAALNDYSASLIGNTSGVSGTTVADALDTLDAGKQPLDAGLTSIAALVTAANKMIYTTALDTYAVADLTAFARTILDDADATAARVTLGLIIGTDVQAYDATLASLALLGTAGDKMVYTTALDTWAETALTAFARTILDDADAATVRGTLGLGSMATQAASAVAITGGDVDGCTFDSIQLDIAAGTPAYSEGLLFYDNVNETLAMYNGEADVILQIGQEMWIRVKNNTGSTITNGQVVYLNGQDAAVPTVALASAASFTSAVPTIGVATHDIETGTIGIITTTGTVRDLNTSAYSPGDMIYVSDTPGAYTTTAPTSPSYKILLGTIVVSDIAVGTLNVHINPLTNTDSIINYWNGTILEDHTINVSSNGTTITCTLEKDGGGDLNLFFNGGFTAFDATPAASVNLTAGSDTAPTRNYVYILESTGLLTASTTGFPATQHVRVADVICPSAATMATEEAYKVHAWTDHIASSANQGHLSDINYWIRNQHATWVSGIAPTFSGTGTGTVGLATTAGVVLQLHDHTFPAFSDPAEIFVYNHFTTPYTKVTNIHNITADSAGVSLNGKTFGLVIWGVVSEEDNECKFFCNLPSGGYGALKPDLVRADADLFQDFSVPTEYKGTAFLLYRLVVSRNIGGTVSTLYVGGAGDDLRGSIPGSTGGSASGSIAVDFSDNQFNIYNVTDNTKQILFSAASIATGTARTITMPDADVTLLKGVTALTTQYRLPFVNAAGTLAESSSITTDATGNINCTKDGIFTIKNKLHQPGVNAQTGVSYTGVLTDAEKIITMTNAASNVFTIPPNASVAYDVNTTMTIIMGGAGVTSVTAGAGVTLNGVSTGSGAIGGTYQAVTILKVATDTWIMFGSHGTVA